MTSAQQILEQARLCQAEGKRWHFHVFPPGCLLNQRPDRYALTLENGTDAQIHVVYGDTPFMEVSQVLVTMLHGKTVLAEECSPTGSDESRLGPVLERARALSARNIYWHHHLLFPDCSYNQHPGKWNIVFEDPEKQETLQILYDQEPLADLRLVETLYFAQIRPAQRGEPDAVDE